MFAKLSVRFGVEADLRVRNLLLHAARVLHETLIYMRIDDVRLHDLRHSCSSIAINAGALVETVPVQANRLGRSLEIFERITHPGRLGSYAPALKAKSL
jgi:integrase